MFGLHVRGRLATIAIQIFIMPFSCFFMFYSMKGDELALLYLIGELVKVSPMALSLATFPLIGDSYLYIKQGQYEVF